MSRWLTSERGIAWLVCIFALTIAVFAAVAVYALSQARGAVDEIQLSRYELCIQQNDRHDKTIASLDEQIAALPPRRKARAEAARDGTVALIDTLAPKRDCEALFVRP